ncbi:type II toxin-antitoxin system HicA family toxin, partial [Lactobacillus salivarius]|nr:type II toxin-antitoxin system HicA family toxin [Ligilactobacillus salivarius]
MGKKDKLLAKLLSKPKDFTFNELETLLEYLGFYLDNV